MDGIVREFALQMLRKLQLRHSESKPRTQPVKDAATNGNIIVPEGESGDGLSGEGDREKIGRAHV